MLVCSYLVCFIIVVYFERIEGYFSIPTSVSTSKISSSIPTAVPRRMKISRELASSSSSSSSPYYSTAAAIPQASWYTAAELWHVGLPSIEMSRSGYLPDRCIISTTDHILEKSDAYFYQDGHIVSDSKNHTVGVVIDISKAGDQNEALALVGSVEWIVLQFSPGAWQMIPVENMVTNRYFV